MAALTQDIHPIRYGSPGNSTQPSNLPLTAASKVYRGSVATTRSGSLVAASSPQSTDLVWGIICEGGPGYVPTGPGIPGTSTAGGAATVDVATGSWWLAAGSGADALTQTNVGTNVYLIDEQTVGATSNGNTRPVAGILLLASDPNGSAILSGKVAVRLGSNQSTGGPS